MANATATATAANANTGPRRCSDTEVCGVGVTTGWRTGCGWGLSVGMSMVTGVMPARSKLSGIGNGRTSVASGDSVGS